MVKEVWADLKERLNLDGQMGKDEGLKLLDGSLKNFFFFFLN